MMKIKFYVKRRKGLMPEISEYPVFVLIETSWNDYGYYTQFILTYYEASRKKIEIGIIKILKKY